MNKSNMETKENSKRHAALVSFNAAVRTSVIVIAAVVFSINHKNHGGMFS